MNGQRRKILKQISHAITQIKNGEPEMALGLLGRALEDELKKNREGESNDAPRTGDNKTGGK